MARGRDERTPFLHSTASRWFRYTLFGDRGPNFKAIYIHRKPIALMMQGKKKVSAFTVHTNPDRIVVNNLTRKKGSISHSNYPDISWSVEIMEDSFNKEANVLQYNTYTRRIGDVGN